ncbi:MULTISPECIES: class I adenylate-forming enzyme family protein [unclassified Streptomyces]|uniref:class I adenylate-forming enzyme family protein n=1 Tax=unclassified Streptomyces TaxID=2593676 RepID=UPI0015874717|nr:MULTISPECIES: class I adenylate-forming enzyme family protein [unclassified Streptomyces]NUV70332.1 acyl--CoA ligase [Streptomyces sp. CAI-121]NUV99378.1 acyl--CoA ligase [Streptomyces sp. CAI 127]NUW16490.1 acyl--CoA ligase [Streptomyces sp. CAI-68]
MNILRTQRSAAQRLRLTLDRQLGAGNFFWHAWRIATDRDRPLLFHPDVTSGTWDEGELPGHSLNDLRITAIRYAHWYRSHGVLPGTHVGVHTRNGLYGLLHHIAITGLGAVAVHCNPKMPVDTAAEYFRRTRTTVLVGDADLLAGCAGAWERSGTTPYKKILTEDIRHLDETAPRPSGPLPGFPYAHRGDDLVMISHSSGTTGRPKAPVFTHASFFDGKRERLWTFPSLTSDRMLTALPHSHSAGISYLSLALLLGIPTLVLDGADGASVVRAVNRFRPTFVLGFPLTLAEVDVAQITPYGAQSIHTWNGMGDASHERHIRPLTALGMRREGRRRVAGSAYVDGLGSSEMGMVLFRTVHTPETTEFGRLIGLPVKAVRDAAVLDEQGRPVPDGQPGLLGVRTPSVTPGYWDDPSLSRDSLSNGYFLTGDVVRREADGRWYHLDRTPDVIHTESGPVHSLPLEESVLLTTQALDTAVVAVEDPDHPGASLPAAVVLFGDDGVPRSARDLLDLCNVALQRKALAPLAALVVAADRTELPVGPTGKILKRVLREEHGPVLRRPAGGPVAHDRAAPAAGPAPEPADAGPGTARETA